MGFSLGLAYLVRHITVLCQLLGHQKQGGLVDKHMTDECILITGLCGFLSETCDTVLRNVFLATEAGHSAGGKRLWAPGSANIVDIAGGVLCCGVAA